VAGTPAYMAPEQFLGLPTEPRSDQFSLCVALWEALQGTRPFPADDLAHLALAVTEGRLGTPARSRIPRFMLDLEADTLSLIAAPWPRSSRW
jgi:serine/threonine protein kinase